MYKVLLVDDEPQILEILADVLENAGYEVDQKTDPKEAKKLIDKNEYDIIFTDLVMPGMSGIEVTEYAKKVNPKVEVIILTGFASLGSALDALKHQVFDYILKPFSISDILAILQKVSERLNLKSENIKLTDKVESAYSSVSTLHEISKLINESEEVPEILNFTLSAIESSVGIKTMAVFLFDSHSETLKIKESRGLTKGTENKFCIKLNEGIIGQAIKEKDTVNITGFEKDDNFVKNVSASDKKKFNSFIAIPLSAQNFFEGFIAVFDLDCKLEEDVEKLRLAEIMAVQVAPMIRLGEYRFERKKMLTDSLFGAKNELINTIKKAGEYRGTLSILIFKLYLRKKANFNIRIFEMGDIVQTYIEKNVSPIDSSLKIGIDSFLVILQGKTKISTEKIAAQIKAEAEKDKVLDKAGFLLDYGYADFPMDGQDFEDLVSKARPTCGSSLKNKLKFQLVKKKDIYNILFLYIGF